MKIIKGEASEIEEQAARQIKDIVRAKPDAAIALAAGRDVKGLYKRLGEMCAAGEVSLKNARILAVTEFSERHDCENFLREQLCAADVSEENCFFPDAAAPEEYDRLIKSLDGLDLAVLGIGQKGEHKTDSFVMCRHRVIGFIRFCSGDFMGNATGSADTLTKSFHKNIFVFHIKKLIL